MQGIKDILENPAPNAMDFLAQINLNVLSTTIYVFTKKGDLHELPKDATALDLAFAIHTDVGMHAEAARVEHVLVPLNTVLENGQQVEIVTSTEERISEEWLGWVTTTKARAKIRQWINKNRPEEAKPVEVKKQNKLLSGLLGMVKKKKKERKPSQEGINRSSTIELSGIDGRGLLNTITRVICDACTANIVNIHLECKDGLFKGYITLDTGDVNAIQKMCAELKKIHEIEKAHLK